MPSRRDVQTVTESGESLTALPEGAEIRELVTHTDERGTVCELYDERWAFSEDALVFAYMFTIRPGKAKGWGVHHEHEDRYAFLSGELELVLYDGREESITAGLESRLILSSHHRRLVSIPRGIWHAERNIGAVDVQVINFPTIPYEHANPDKYRLRLDTDELPVVLGPDWRGW